MAALLRPEPSWGGHRDRKGGQNCPGAGSLWITVNQGTCWTFPRQADLIKVLPTSCGHHQPGVPVVKLRAGPSPASGVSHRTAADVEAASRKRPCTLDVNLQLRQAVLGGSRACRDSLFGVRRPSVMTGSPPSPMCWRMIWEQLESWQAWTRWQ